MAERGGIRTPDTFRYTRFSRLRRDPAGGGGQASALDHYVVSLLFIKSFLNASPPLYFLICRSLNQAVF